jgi:hypothetical protein
LIENVFAWSKSRDEQFRECQRKYFYDKYASWGGWDRNAPPQTRLVYVLKNLKNRWAWKGETVHHVIEDVLKSLRAGKPVGLDEALGKLTAVMRRDYRSSKNKKYLENPKNNLGLFEHEYEKGISDAVWKKIHDEAGACIRNFYQSGIYRELLEDDKKTWLVIEDLDDYEFQGAKIFVKLDFARRHGNTVEIYDWKTGKNEGADVSVQMGVYAIFAMKKWGAALPKIRGFLVNLASALPEAQEKPIDETLIGNTEAFMTKSIAGMQGLLADPSKNVPKPKDFFKFTENTRLCDSCNFYKICDKYAQ